MDLIRKLSVNEVFPLSTNRTSSSHPEVQITRSEYRHYLAYRTNRFARVLPDSSVRPDERIYPPPFLTSRLNLMKLGLPYSFKSMRHEYVREPELIARDGEKFKSISKEVKILKRMNNDESKN